MKHLKLDTDILKLPSEVMKLEMKPRKLHLGQLKHRGDTKPGNTGVPMLTTI
jgi:hypothetical protein